MRGYTRIVFGLNVLYQGAVGLLSLFMPALVIGLYQGTEADQRLAILRAAFRLIGANIVFGGVVSALIAKDPDESPVLLPLMGALGVLTLLCWGAAYGAGEMNVGQFGADIVAQILLLAAVIGYYPRAKRARRSPS